MECNHDCANCPFACSSNTERDDEDNEKNK